MTLSIDLGPENTAFAFFDDEMKLLEFNLLKGYFNRITILERGEKIRDFLSSYVGKIKRLVIEEQLPVNKKCSGMYDDFVCSFKSLFAEGSVVGVHPLDKFKALHVWCHTKNKQHKKQVVEMVKSYLSVEQLEKFNEFKKKDDISDAILQAITLKGKVLSNQTSA
jgi:hypothetical protein